MEACWGTRWRGCRKVAMPRMSCPQSSGPSWGRSQQHQPSWSSWGGPRVGPPVGGAILLKQNPSLHPNWLSLGPWWGWTSGGARCRGQVCMSPGQWWHWGTCHCREESCKGGPRWWLERPPLNVRVRVCPRAVYGPGTPSPKHECTVGQAAVGEEPPGLEPSAHMGTRGHLGVSPSWKFMRKVWGWADKS